MQIGKNDLKMMLFWFSFSLKLLSSSQSLQLFNFSCDIVNSGIDTFDNDDFKYGELARNHHYDHNNNNNNNRNHNYDIMNRCIPQSLRSKISQNLLNEKQFEDYFQFMIWRMENIIIVLLYQVLFK
jgi:hypothetical protein